MIPLIIGLGIGAFLVVTFWDDIVEWLVSFTESISEAFRKIGHATKIFAKKVKDKAFQVLHRLFYKEDKKWIEETTRREVPESEVPEWAKQGVQESEHDVTETYKQELQLTL